MYKCTYCDQAVEPGDFNAHAEKHFIETRGIDANGQPVSSRINVNYTFIQ